MGLWPFGRSKADIESASRVIVLRARDGLAMRAKVTVRLSEPQTQAAADELAERAADLLRAVVREAPRAPAVLGLEVALAAEVTTRMLKEPIPLRGIEIAGLHIVGDPGHLTQPAASSMSSPAWMQAAHASPPSSSTPDWPDRSLDRPTPVQPLPAARPDLSSAAASSAAKPASSAKPASAPKPTVARPGAPRPAPAGAPASGPTSPDRAQPAFSAAPASPARAAADALLLDPRPASSPRGTPASAPPPPERRRLAVAPAVAPTAAATPTAAAAPAVAPTAAATPAAAPGCRTHCRRRARSHARYRRRTHCRCHSGPIAGHHRPRTRRRCRRRPRRGRPKEHRPCPRAHRPVRAHGRLGVPRPRRAAP
ncbi:MAG: hypothetical protein R3F14_22505 [Polyangiaceae bacterium]